MITLAAAVLTAVLSTLPAHAAGGPAPALRQQVRTLLDDYGRKDLSGIMAMLDGGDVLMMGTGINEVGSSREQIKALLASDFRLWDASRFGAYKNFFVRTSEDMATVFTDVPWQARTGAQTRSFVIRLVTVWHRTNSGWKLAQILDAVPTGGNSA